MNIIHVLKASIKITGCITIEIKKFHLKAEMGIINHIASDISPNIR
jgi:hypothetical protein